MFIHCHFHTPDGSDKERCRWWPEQQQQQQPTTTKPSSDDYGAAGGHADLAYARHGPHDDGDESEPEPEPGSQPATCPA